MHLISLGLYGSRGMQLQTLLSDVSAATVTS